MDRIAGQSNGDLGQMAQEMVPGVAAEQGAGFGESGIGRNGVVGVGENGAVGSSENGIVKNTETEMGRVAAQALGRNVSLGFASMSAEQGFMAAEQELGRDERELTRPLEFVGDETKEQVQERLAADDEDLRNEANLPPAGATEAEKALINRDHKIVQKVQDAVTIATAGKVEAIMKQLTFRPGEIAELRQKAMLNMLSGAFNYKFGDGN